MIVNIITDSIELEEHCGTLQPKDPWNFAKAIENAQDFELRRNKTHHILFNKGRYFETSIYDTELRNKISTLTWIQVEYDNMICGSWKLLESFVQAMNSLGIYVSIKIDWV